jgi:hypothetical protein
MRKKEDSFRNLQLIKKVFNRISKVKQFIILTLFKDNKIKIKNLKIQHKLYYLKK